MWLLRRRVRFARVLPMLLAAVGAGALLTWKVFPTFAELWLITLRLG